MINCLRWIGLESTIASTASGSMLSLVPRDTGSMHMIITIPGININYFNIFSPRCAANFSQTHHIYVQFIVRIFTLCFWLTQSYSPCTVNGNILKAFNISSFFFYSYHYVVLIINQFQRKYRSSTKCAQIMYAGG